MAHDGSIVAFALGVFAGIVGTVYTVGGWLLYTDRRDTRDRGERIRAERLAAVTTAAEAAVIPEAGTR